MNKDRRDRLGELKSAIEEAKGDLDTIKEEEEEAFENLPESLQGTENAAHMEECAQYLGDAVEGLQTALDSIDLIVE